MLSLREEEYVQSMRAFGLSDFVIAYKHMLPNAIGPRGGKPDTFHRHVHSG